MSTILAGTSFLAGLTANSGTRVRDIVLGIIGMCAIVVLAARGLAAFADERYGKIASLVAAAIPVTGFCYFPDQTLGILKGLFSAFMG